MAEPWPASPSPPTCTHDVPRSRASAESLASRWRDGRFGDAEALVVVGDAATSDGGGLERCLALFPPDRRPRLFVPGNHELWSKRSATPAEVLMRHELPARVAAAGWHWLPGSPFVFGDGTAVVGTPGWYDHAYASERLGLPGRFYDAGVSPAAAGPELRPDADDVPAGARGFFARWNDKRWARGIASDGAFCGRRLAEFGRDLDAVAGCGAVLAAVHVCPTRRLLPTIPAGEHRIPPDKLKYAFARAYLGSPAFGDAAASRANVRHVVCGHSHVRRSYGHAGVCHLNVGSGYAEKRLDVIDLTAEC